MTDTAQGAPQPPAPQGLSLRLQSAALWAEIAAAIAVVISLVFVGLQIQQNTRATRAASAFEINRMWAEFNIRASMDADQSLLFRKLLNPSLTEADFTEEERARLDILILGIAQAHMAQFRLYQEGSLAPRDWERDGKWASQFRKLPLVRRYYENIIATKQIDPDFMTELDRLDELTGSGDRVLLLTAVPPAEPNDVQAKGKE
ncbi:MAG: hypothetical protein AAF251_11680 [Pseudomonadota bacterium]